MYYIYALIDPRDSLIHYIGLTGNSPAKRLAEHLKDHTGAKAQWLTSLIDSSFMPSFIVLQKADDVEQAQLRESWWISTGEMLGWPLTNIAKTSRTKTSTLKQAQPKVRKEVAEEIEETSVNRWAYDLTVVPPELTPVFEKYIGLDGRLRRGGIAAALRALHSDGAPTAGKQYQVEARRVEAWCDTYRRNNAEQPV